MRVLIYGEFSGYGESLARGFKTNGWEAEVFSPNGDSFKEIDSALRLTSRFSLIKIFQLMCLIPTFCNFDKILITNPSFFSIFKGAGIIPLLIFLVLKKDLYLICCGDDVEYVKSGENGTVKKYIYSGVKYPKKKYFSRRLDVLVNHLCASYAKKIIPVMYDYEIAWKNSIFFEKLTKTIPLACFVEPKPRVKPVDYNCINILHGVNRPSVKGTDKIISALDKLKKEFSNIVIHCPVRLKKQDYLSLFDKIDIAIDQSKGHSYGMNAIYSMMYGHIVLAPADENFNSSFGIHDNPIIAIEYDEDYIYEQLKKLIISRNLDQLKMATQEFAFKHHDCNKVALQFMALM